MLSVVSLSPPALLARTAAQYVHANYARTYSALTRRHDEQGDLILVHTCIDVCYLAVEMCLSCIHVQATHCSPLPCPAHTTLPTLSIPSLYPCPGLLLYPKGLPILLAHAPTTLLRMLAYTLPLLCTVVVCVTYKHSHAQ